MKPFLWTSLGLFALAATLAVSAPTAGSDHDGGEGGIEAITAHLGDGHGPGMGRRGGHQGRGFRQQGMRGMHGFGTFERLDLTAEQRERITAIRDREQREAIEARAGLETAGLDLRKLMRDESPNLSQINAQIDRIARMRADLQKSRVAAMIEARDLLSSDQRAKLREGREGRMNRGRTPAPTPDDSQ